MNTDGNELYLTVYVGVEYIPQFNAEKTQLRVDEGNSMKKLTILAAAAVLVASTSANAEITFGG